LYINSTYINIWHFCLLCRNDL